MSTKNASQLDFKNFNDQVDNLIDSMIENLRKCIVIFRETTSEKIKHNKSGKCSNSMVTPLQHVVYETLKANNAEPKKYVNNENRVVLEPYKDETQMADIMRVITKDLSEPYSIYTYRYFINNWPELCILARDKNSNEYVGVIICKLDKEINGYITGYIAMLAVDSSFRNMGIGTRLVETAVSLETEVTNKNSTNLYMRLGFLREKRLYRYYLNGVDAFRLKLLFKRDAENEESYCGLESDIETLQVKGTECCIEKILK